jgi:DNA-binding CsgD family transcriptional regulator
MPRAESISDAARRLFEGPIRAYDRRVMSSVVGRDAELASLGDFFASLSEGASALVLEGEAGVGKTTLWRAGIAAAEERGLLVLQALPSESETSLSFSGLGDLLDPVFEEALEPLPAGQRSALARALVLEEAEGPPPDAHAVGVAVLNALRGLANAGPVLVAVDDVQWLDSASADALTYAGRRLRTEPVGLLFSRRSELESRLSDEVRRVLPADRFRTVDVGPLDLGSMHRVVQDQLGVALPRPLLAEVHEASGGNPFYALEFVRMLRRTGVSVEAGQPLPVPESLHELVHGRLLALSDESRDYLLAAAAHAHPTVSLAESASGVGRELGLPPALEARIVELDRERIRFTHPLLAAGAYETADPIRRREIHSRLAELLEDPEARAWQLAASVNEPDEAVAAVLEEAAHHARARGAPRPAALLLDRACELTPGDRLDEGHRRAVDAAYLHYESGDSPRAEARLRYVVGQLAPGATRARALIRLARVRAYDALPEAVELFLQAVAEAEGDRELLAVAHEGVATCLWRLFERLEEALEHADLAAQLALKLGNEALAGEALGTRLVAELLLGKDTAPATAEMALALQPAADDLRVLAQPRSSVAMDYLGWLGDLEHARGEMTDLLRRASDLGDESSPPFVLAHLSLVECDLGDLEGARERALEGQEASEQSGQRAILAFNLAVESLAQAQLGREEEARIAARRALELVPETGGRQAELVVVRALGHLELSLGDPGAAVDRIEPALAFVRREAIAEPCEIVFVVDYVEALVELDRREKAIELLDWYEGNARRLERSSALANCMRCRGLLAAQAGELEDALEAYREALDWHAKVALPLDRGRSLLALGAAQRRAKRRREARATLEEALAIFERIGAALWAERVRAELRRISGRAATPGALTPAEERVAALVAEGKTNREVAAALFLSERTVEGHLSHVFGKLGIKHRAELVPALASRQTQEVSSSNTGDSPVSGAPSAP